MAIKDECVAAAAQAIREEVGYSYLPDEHAEAAFNAILATLKARELVYRDGGQVVHELRGSPNDIWQAMLSALEQESKP